MPIRREVVMVAVLFVVGIASGLYFGRALSGEPHTAPADYAVLVARGFEFDGSVSLATARLRDAGVENPAEAVAAIAASYPTGTPEQIRDAESLKKLAQALRPTGAASTSSTGIPTSYVLTGLVALGALGLLALLAFRILGIRAPSLPKSQGSARSGSQRHRSGTAPGGSPAITWSRPDSARPSPDARLAEGAPPDPVDEKAGEPASRSAGPVVSPNGAHLRTRPMQPNEAAASANGSGRPKSGKGVAPAPIRPSHLRADPPQRGYSFRSSYRLGDEPYDEIHPISDDSGRSLVGACGVSASQFLSDHGQKRYWGFVAWLHDYASDGQFRAVGLVSRWAHDHFADEIDDWRNQGDIDEVRLVGYDEEIRIETTHLSAALSVEDFDYVQGAPPEAVFSRLAAQFEVELHRATSAGSHDEQAG